MAIKTAINTQNGLSFEAAVLVITVLTDIRSDNYNYQVAPLGKASPDTVKYQSNINDAPRRQSQFQVSVFANEELLRAGQPAVAFLHNDVTGQPAFQCDLNDKSPLSRIEQAYEHLKSQYPESIDIDVTDLGLV